MKYHRIKYLTASVLKRREMLGLMGGAITVSLLGCFRDQSALSEPTSNSATLKQTTPITTAQTSPTCVVKPQQTEGPYFVDERLDRSDIRLQNNVVQPGVLLKLAFRVSQINGSACIPLSGAIVDIWHCNALGVYSDVVDRSFNTVGQNFLRGYQETDANGRVEFMTIYPGWYQGRTVHIHFKIRTKSESQTAYEFTSQLYFDDALTDQVHAQAPYSTKGERTLRNNQDRIFRAGGEQLLLQLREAATGYETTFDIGLKLA
jgi:protocatechuate 3,4-dioxygenase beta subunit